MRNIEGWAAGVGSAPRHRADEGGDECKGVTRRRHSEGPLVGIPPGDTAQRAGLTQRGCWEGLTGRGHELGHTKAASLDRL